LIFILKKYLFYLLFIQIYFVSFKIIGQNNPQNIISIELKEAKITELVSQIEKQTDFYFYYDSSQFDSLSFTISAIKLPLGTVLEQAFSPINFFYTIDNQHNIFITKGRALNLELPTELLISNKNEAENSPINNAKYESDDDEKDLKTKIGLENKIFEIGQKTDKINLGNATLAGYIKNAKTGEAVIGASVFIENPRIGKATDQYGYYSISIQKGSHVLNILSIDMKDTKRKIVLYSDGKLNIDMQETVTSLKEVVISTQKRSNIKSTQMGLQKIDIKTIKQVPVVFGEADLLKAVTTLPGVKTVGEASTGLNVRGGAADQNLILFNEGTIYNPSHFFGLFSAFNPETVKEVELYKSSIPAKYGGRLSSVININSREGNKKNFTGSAGLGMLTGRLNLEGPIVKDKSSFIIGGRTTYANWLLNLLPDQYKNSKASFYDLNLNLSHEINKNNNLYFSGYLSNDQFNLNNDTLYSYGNKNISLKWKHIFNNKLTKTTSIGHDYYGYNISSSRLPPSAYKLGFNINQSYFKTHFNYYLNDKHTLDFGLNSVLYNLQPGNYKPLSTESLIKPEIIEAEKALETGIYFSDHYELSNALSLDGGIRFAIYNYLGPHTVNKYAENSPKTEGNLSGTETYEKNKIIHTYNAPEFRFSMRYAFNETFSIKTGYNTQRQYIHSLSNTTSMAPTDIWKLSDPNIKPQQGDQISLGLYKNLKSNTIETSAEVYYKNISNYLDYKSGAKLILNHHIETEVIGTKGKAYGVEILIKKLTGKMTGWISYTWSRVLLKMDDPNAGELINKGNWYPSNYDKPHDFTFIGNYRFSHRFSTSLNATYSTGRPITLPVGVFYYMGSYRTMYADRNGYRIPDYFRADFAMNIEGNHKIHQKTHNSWTIGVYNITGRKNPYSVYYIAEKGQINGYKLSIFGSAIPYINFNIRF
jgi:CarboxypepD_reg-like domain/TonB-dependent Receptor Plug Domain